MLRRVHLLPVLIGLAASADAEVCLVSQGQARAVVATADGVVTEARWDGGLGWLVTINHGHGYKTRYGHNHKLLVKKGDKVRRGDVIALEGSTGRTTGPHVHYEVICDGKNVNPYRYLVR